jgi:putative two-component system response regulator
MVFHLRRERGGFSPQRFAELALISSLLGQSIQNLARARELELAEKSIKEQYDIIAKLSTTVMNSAMDLKETNELLEMKVRHRTAELSEANLDAIYMLAEASEARDDDTGAHVRRIEKYARAIASELGMDRTSAEAIGYSSILHDVGKIHVPDSILKKPGPLTDEEWVLMRQHTTIGESILSEKPFFARARNIARSHHENFDGSGYPDAKAGNEIPIEARIVHLVDVFDALTHPRVYKKAWPQLAARGYIRDEAGKMFDPEVALAFASVMAREPKETER